MKRISRFHPTARRAFEEAERHYLEVHHRFARQLFRYRAPAVRRYATARAIAQYDINGRFDRSPDIWRFIVLRFDDPNDNRDGTAGKEWLPSWAEQLIVEDHTNFLREIRPFVVEENDLVDNRSGQLTTAKFVFELETDGERDTQEVVSAREQLRDVLVEQARDAFGLRLFTENRVVSEAAMSPVVEPGQRYAGTLIEQPTMAYFDEYYFDHRAWGEEFFASPTVLEALRGHPVFTRVGGYFVEELVGVDR